MNNFLHRQMCTNLAGFFVLNSPGWRRSLILCVCRIPFLMCDVFGANGLVQSLHTTISTSGLEYYTAHTAVLSELSSSIVNANFTSRNVPDLQGISM